MSQKSGLLLYGYQSTPRAFRPQWSLWRSQTLVGGGPGRPTPNGSWDRESEVHPSTICSRTAVRTSTRGTWRPRDVGRVVVVPRATPTLQSPWETCRTLPWSLRYYLTLSLSYLNPMSPIIRRVPLLVFTSFSSRISYQTVSGSGLRLALEVTPFLGLRDDLTYLITYLHSCKFELSGLGDLSTIYGETLPPLPTPQLTSRGYVPFVWPFLKRSESNTPSDLGIPTFFDQFLSPFPLLPLSRAPGSLSFDVILLSPPTRSLRVLCPIHFLPFLRGIVTVTNCRHLRKIGKVRGRDITQKIRSTVETRYLW